MENVLFREQQAFRQTWMWLLLLSALGSLTWGVIQQVILGDPWGDNPMPDWALLLTWALMIALNWMMAVARLDVRISTERIRFRFYPFHLQHREIFWEEVEKAALKTYSPLREYGGWGIRWGRKGKAFNVAGRDGLQLELTEGRRLLLGTQKREELEEAMAYLYEESIVRPD